MAATPVKKVETDDGEDPLKCGPRDKAKARPRALRWPKAEREEDNGQTPTYTRTLEDKDD